MKMAQVIAQRSPDPHTQVGAIITSPDHIILGAGYNGMPRGQDQDSWPWEKGEHVDFLQSKYTFVVHAEANAIYNAHGPLDGAIIYTTLFPCNECAKAIVQNGIKTVVFDEYQDKDSTKAAEYIFQQSSIKYLKQTS